MDDLTIVVKKLELRIVALELDMEEIKRREKDEVACKLADAQARLAMLKQEQGGEAYNLRSAQVQEDEQRKSIRREDA